MGFGFNWVLFSCEVCQFWSDSIFHYDYCAVCFGFLGYPVCERHFGIDPTANAVARANPSVLAGRTCDLNEAWYSILICVGSHDSTVHELTKAAQSLLIKLFFCCELRDHIAQQLKYFRMSTSTVAATEARGQQIAKSRAVRCKRTAFSYWKAVLDAKKSRALEISYRTRMMHFQILFRTRKKKKRFQQRLC